MTRDTQATLDGTPPPKAPPAWDSAQVDRLIRDGDFQTAADAIYAMLQMAPRHLPARLAEVRLLLGRGDVGPALALAEALVQERPETPWTWLCQFQALVKGGAHTQAVAVFCAGLERLAPGPDASALINGANVLLPGFSAADQIRLLQTALAVNPTDSTLLIRLAMRAHANGDVRLAAEMLHRAEQVVSPLPAYAARLKSQLLPLTHGMPAASDLLLQQVQAGATDVETLCRLSRFAAAAGRFDLAHQALFDALDRHPMEWRSLYRLNRLFPSAQDEARIFARLSDLAKNPAATPAWLMQFALFALRAGQIETAHQALTDLAADPLLGETTRSLIAALNVIGPPLPRPDLRRDDHVSLVRHPDAKATLVVFAGFVGMCQIPLHHIDRLLAGLPAHVIYLRDPYAQAFMRGIPELGPDETAMQQALGRMVADLGTKRLVTLGNSASGYSALRNGLALGADRVLSFAGFVTPGAGDPDDPGHARQGMAELFQGDLAQYDLRPGLQAQGRTRLVHVLAGAYRPDLVRAQDLDGIAQAEIHVLPGVASHHVALHAIADGTFQRLLADALSG